MEKTDYKNIILLLILLSLVMFIYFQSDIYVFDMFTDHSNLDSKFSNNMKNSVVENSEYQLNSEFIDKFKDDKNKHPKNDYTYQVNDTNIIDNEDASMDADMDVDDEDADMDADMGIDDEDEDMDADMGIDDEDADMDADMGIDDEDVDMGIDEDLPDPYQNTNNNAGSLEEFYTNFGENFQTYSY